MNILYKIKYLHTTQILVLNFCTLFYWQDPNLDFLFKIQIIYSIFSLLHQITITNCTML